MESVCVSGWLRHVVLECSDRIERWDIRTGLSASLQIKRFLSLTTSPSASISSFLHMSHRSTVPQRCSHFPGPLFWISTFVLEVVCASFWPVFVCTQRWCMRPHFQNYLHKSVTGSSPAAVLRPRASLTFNFFVFYGEVFSWRVNEAYGPYVTLFNTSVKILHVTCKGSFALFTHLLHNQRAIVKTFDFPWASILCVELKKIAGSMLATFQIVAVVTHVQIALVSDACISVLCVCVWPWHWSISLT